MFNIKETTTRTGQVLGVGILYGVIFAALFLAPFPMNQTIGQSSNDCSFVHFVITPGYGSDHDGGGFSGYICYEDYDDLLKCLQMAENNYQNALVKARNEKKKCAKNCNGIGLGGGLGCFILGVVTGGAGGVGCYLGAAGSAALCLFVICRSQYTNDLEDAACDADTAVKNCLVAHGATMEQLEDAPFSPGVIENPLNLPR